MMLKQIGSATFICLDSAAKAIKVFTNEPLIPGFLGDMREVGSFSTSQAWEVSSYSRQVADEDMKEAVAWFWIDLESESQEAQVPEKQGKGLLI